jgi:ferric-dicitrate binding protein FerR (iron transport regulator)
MSSAQHRDPEMDGLLVKYLLGEASAEERERVSAWCALDMANRKYFDDFRVLWDTGRALAPTPPVEEDEAWGRFLQRRDAGALTPSLRVPSRFSRRWVAAALILLAAGAGAWIYIGRLRTLTLDAQTATLTQTLPDGSEVTLNKHSTLQYPAHFGGNDRPVTLQGEGFFRIAPDARQPFLVRVGAATVRVLGTSFNVRNRSGGTEVVVETGRVEVSLGNRRQEIGPGEKALIAPGGADVQKQSSRDALYQYYRTRVFVCRATPLQELVQVLSEAYDTHILIDKAGAGDLLLTVNLHDQSLESVLDIVTQTLGLTWSKQGAEVVIK